MYSSSEILREKSPARYRPLFFLRNSKAVPLFLRA